MAIQLQNLMTYLVLGVSLLILVLLHLLAKKWLKELNIEEL
jgi:hypothetical protein